MVVGLSILTFNTLVKRKTGAIIYDKPISTSPLFSSYFIQRADHAQRREFIDVAVATFLLTFIYDGIFAPACWGGGGVHTVPLSLLLPTPLELSRLLHPSPAKLVSERYT